jgi:hypothetical protein
MAGLACEATLSDGWAYVDFSNNKGDPCGDGYGASASVSAVPPTDGACACSCGGPNGDPCATMKIQFNQKDKTGCGGSTLEVTNDGACHSFAPAFAKGNRSAIADLTAAKVPCSATAQLPPTAFAGRSCATAAAPASCSGGPGVCIPEVAGPRCVEKAGAQNACPAGYGTPHIVYADSAIIDNRTCACECESDASTCSGAQVKLYADTYWCNNSNGSATDVPTDSTCQDFTIPTWDRSAYKSAPLTPNVTTCSPKDPAPSVGGSVALVVDSEARTICCAP